MLLIAVLLAGAVPVAMAAGSAYISGPETVRAGDTITLSFYAGGGIFGGSGSVSYDPSQLTLQGYTPAIGGSWAVEFSGNNFVFYDNSMSAPIDGAVIFTAAFVVNASAAEGTVLSVSANHVTLSDGKQDMGVGTCTYSVTVAPPLSDNCRLASMQVANAVVTPGFSPDVLEYSASVPFEISALMIEVAAEHGGAQVTVHNPELAVASTTTVSVTVTAENGAARTYAIHVFRAQDPNYVPSSNGNLKELAVEGYMLSPAFSVEQMQYYVWLPYETETVTVKADAEDHRAKVSIAQQPELIPGQGNEMVITVTAEDGTQRKYTLTVVRAPEHSEVDRFLHGEPEPTVPPQPETEPTEEPTAAPTTEPETHQATVPVQPQAHLLDVPALSMPILVTVCLACVLVGAAVGVAAMYAANRKKK